MKAKKTLLLLLAILMLDACKYDDSDLWNQVNKNTEELAAQAARIAALEAWQAETNTNIEALQTLLSTRDYITAVTPIVKDGVEVGYTISFLNSPAVTIYHGTKGDTGAQGEPGTTPQIGLTKGEDGNWYWTLNGELMTDTEGNPIRANGEQGDPGTTAPLPQLATGTKLTGQGIATDTQGDAIADDAIYLSADGGKTWTRVSGKDGEKGDTGPQGDSLFESVGTSNADYILFTLADGNRFQVPRYTGISLSFGMTSASLLYGGTKEIQCTAEGSADFTTDNLFVVAPAGWKAGIALTRAASTGFTLTVTAPDEASEGEILVMLDNKKGSTTIGRISVKASSTLLEGTTLTGKSVKPGDLKAAIGSRNDLTSITVESGEINYGDWGAIRNNEWGLRTIDLAGAAYHTTNLLYERKVYVLPLPLTTVKLPQGVSSIGEYAFFNCELTSVELPAALTNIGAGAFGSCPSLTTVTCLAETPPTIGERVFNNCTALTSIYVPAASVEAYKAAWSKYADKITAIP